LIRVLITPQKGKDTLKSVSFPQLVEKPLFRRIRPSIGGGARGGGSPPRVGSNALNALLGKAFSERSEDFSTAQRRESNGILLQSENRG